VTFPFSSYPDEDVRAYAAANSGIFSEIRLSRITVADEETANRVVARLDARELPFDEMARDESQDSYAEDGGLMGWIRYHDITDLISSEEADGLFSLSAGSIAGPFETRFGWVVFRVEQAATAPNPDDILDDVRAYMESDEVGLLEDAMISRAEAFREAAAASGFNVAASEENLEVGSTGFFPLNYGGDTLIGGVPDTSTHPELVPAVRSDEFWVNTLALAEIGDVSEPVVLGDAVVVFTLGDVRDAQAFPEEWSDWRRQQMEAEFMRTRQDDLQGLVLDSPLLRDEFSSAYARVFPEG
jgi:parvulin-like peptidyl-prolyl isomerase